MTISIVRMIIARTRRERTKARRFIVVNSVVRFHSSTSSVKPGPSLALGGLTRFTYARLVDSIEWKSRATRHPVIPSRGEESREGLRIDGDRDSSATAPRNDSSTGAVTPSRAEESRPGRTEIVVAALVRLEGDGAVMTLSFRGAHPEESRPNVRLITLPCFRVEPPSTQVVPIDVY